jgi:hypothetical protein
MNEQKNKPLKVKKKPTNKKRAANQNGRKKRKVAKTETVAPEKKDNAKCPV